MCDDGQPRTSCVCWRTPTDIMCMLTDTHVHTWTATDVLCVLADCHRQPRTSCVCWRTSTDVLCVLNSQPMLAKSPKQSTGRTSVLIYVLMDSSRRPVCADKHRQTHIQPRMSCVCWQTPTDVLCVLNRQPAWAKITRTIHEKGRRAESKDTHGHTRTSCVC